MQKLVPKETKLVTSAASADRQNRNRQLKDPARTEKKRKERGPKGESRGGQEVGQKGRDGLSLGGEAPKIKRWNTKDPVKKETNQSVQVFSWKRESHTSQKEIRCSSGRRG